MRFKRVHTLSSYLLVGTSSLTLLSGGATHLAVAALTLIGLPLSWRRGEKASARPWLWNLLTLGALAWTIVRILQGTAALAAGGEFITLLLLNKLFNRSALKDLQQMYLLSFLQMVAATALNSGLLFALAFIAYIIFATWTLMLFHLRREVEENFLLKYDDSAPSGRPVQVERVLNSRRLVSGRFLLVSSALALVICLGAAGVFFLFPRVGFGWLSGGSRPGVQMTGFSDRIELGSFGRIKSDDTVVMRVRFDPPEARSQQPLYWRGVALDRYDGQAWRKTRRFRRGLTPEAGGLRRMPWSEGEPSDWIKQEIYLEPMAQQVLFSLAPLEAVRLSADEGRGRRPHLELDRQGDVYYDQRGALAFRYEAYTSPRARPAALDMPLSAYRSTLAAQQRFARRFTQLPDNLSPEIAALAAEIVGDAPTVGEAARRVRDHLRTQYSYTLDLQRDPTKPPLDDFLFQQRAGHCEYFATAMVMLLRTQGVAARSVNGFLGGTWNEVGEYVAVRQGDAHAWVEIWWPGGGWGPASWWPYDPTPAAEVLESSAEDPSLIAQAVDALTLRWYRWVIEYDLAAQIGALQAISDAVKSAFQAVEPVTRWRPRGDALWILLGGAALIFGLWRWRHRRPKAATAAHHAQGMIHRLSRHYGALGLPRPPSATAREYLDLLRGGGAPAIEVASALVSLYEEARFSGAPLDPDQRAQAEAALDDIAAAVAAHRAQAKA